LRENRDSLVATLEAFVHDPLISWRLLNTKKYVLFSCRFL
jgi:serine/threonine-protein kinase mTOR